MWLNQANKELIHLFMGYLVIIF